MVSYKMVVKPGVMVKPMSSDLVKVIELANKRLKDVYPWKNRYIVTIHGFEIADELGIDRARAVIVEAIAKANYISLRSQGTSWGLFAKILFDGSDLKVEYRQRAASVLKATMMEVDE